MRQLLAQECVNEVALYTRVMKKYGYDNKNHKYGIGIVLNPEEREPENRQEYQELTGGKNINIKDLYTFYKKSVYNQSLKTMKGNDGILYDMIDAKHVDYPKRSQYESRTVEVGRYDAINSKYSIDMDYLDSLEEDKKENYIKQSFLNHYLFLGTAFDDKHLYSDQVQKFLDTKPFFSFEVPEAEEVSLSWPILDNYDERGIIDDDDYLDIKKFLEVDDDSILLCMVADPNPDYPDYYEPEPEFIFPISRSYLKNLYNPLNEDGTYKEDFTSFAYRCAKDIEGIDDDLTFNVTMNQLYLLSPYFKITGGPQELYINTRDAMMLMYSKHKVFALRKEKEIPINAGINVVNVGRDMNVFNQYVNVVSADHCQGGSNKPIYRVFMSEIEDYTEVERESEQKTEAITKEELYKKYPEVKDIIENTQRDCKDPDTMKYNQVMNQTIQYGIRDNYYDPLTEEHKNKLRKVYEKTAKIKKVMSLGIPHEAKVRAQQEIEESGITALTKEKIAECISVLEPEDDDMEITFEDKFDDIVEFYGHYEGSLNEDEMDDLERILDNSDDINALIEHLHRTFGLQNEQRLRDLIDEDGETDRFVTDEMLFSIQQHYNIMEEGQQIDLEDIEDEENIDGIITMLRRQYGLGSENMLRRRLQQIVDEVPNRINASQEEPLARQLNFGEEEPLARQLNFGEEEPENQLGIMDMEVLEPSSDDEYVDLD